MTLAGVALATGATGSVVSTVVGEGEMDAGVGFAARAGNEDDRYDLRVRAELVQRVALASRQGACHGAARHVTAYHAKECEPRVYEAGDAFVERPGL